MSSSVEATLGGAESVLLLASKYIAPASLHTLTHTACPNRPHSCISRCAYTWACLLPPGLAYKSFGCPSKHTMDALTMKDNNTNKWHIRGWKHKSKPRLFMLNHSKVLTERKSGTNLHISFPTGGKRPWNPHTLEKCKMSLGPNSLPVSFEYYNKLR